MGRPPTGGWGPPGCTVTLRWSTELQGGAYSDTAVCARGVCKSFGKFRAVDGVDFDVRSGEAFGFLGANGAGKTSTMRMIACVSPVSAGRLWVLGLDSATDSRDIRSQLGIVPQSDSLDGELSVFENAFLYARYFFIPRREARRRARELLEFVQLTDKAGQRVETLSGGMRRRLMIARALINRPKLLMLDEPTTGLDPQARHLVWDRLLHLRQAGTTLVLTTHYMDEAERLCDRIVVMDRGRIAAQGTPWELIDRYASREVVELRLDASRLGPAVKARIDSLADRVDFAEGRIILHVRSGEVALAGVRRAGVRPQSVLMRQGSLEDVYLAVTGRSLIE